ncbi:hypothetical protein D3C81_1753350 [compost metagenome]
MNKCGQYINEKLDLGYNPKLILLFAYFHDLFAYSRNNHQELSATWVATTDHPFVQELEASEREWLAHACREHRASYEGEYSCQFSELAAAADRGFPGRVEGMVQRAVMYRVDRGVVEQEAYPGAVEHIKEKFGSGGYAKYPKLYTDAFGEQLAEQRKEVDAL